MSVRPERHLARQLQRSKDYYYLIGTPLLGVGFEKRLSSQYETATRLYYPMSGRSMIKWLICTCFLLLLLAPVVLILAWQWNQLILTYSWILILILEFSFAFYCHRTYGNLAWRIRVLIWPILLVQELALLIASFIAYKFGNVTWKGRAVNAQPTNRAHLSVNE